MDIEELKRTLYGLDLIISGTDATLTQGQKAVAKGGTVNISFDLKQQRYLTTFTGPLEGVPSDKHFGKTLKNSRFVTLDMKCDEWKASAKFASFSYNVNGNMEGTIKFSPDVITLTRTNPTAGRKPRMEATTHRITDFLWDHVTREETPLGGSFARDHVEFALENARCDIRQRKDLPYATITIDFTSNISTDEMESTLRSILMALSIRLGKQVNAQVVTIDARNKKIIKLSLTETGSAAAAGRMPPLPRTLITGNSEFLATATRFFRNPAHKYVYWYLLTVWQSESAVFEVKEVCTGVAVEQVCSHFAEQHQAIDKTRSKAFIKARDGIAQAMQNLPYDWQADHPKRILAMVSDMSPVNTREKIMAVAKLLNLRVTEAQYKSWSDCRNGSAHFRKKRKNTEGRASDWLVCLTTLHRLVLAIIGWHGVFVDYSKPNYPSRLLRRRKSN
jgi:hypothetical protein